MAYRSALVNVMEAAARKAARGLIRDFGEVEQLQVSRKGPADFVSQADTRAERILREELSRARPDWGFQLEEGGAIAGRDPAYRWIIDPLDGTTNFLHGIPHFAISIGLEHRGEPFAGLILDPIKDELFWAERGQGAYLNNHRMRVSSRARLADSLLATGIPFHGWGDHARALREISTVMGEVSGIRRMGAAALDLAYVAAGRYEGFWEWDLNPWDVCAGIVMVREAGGLVSEIDGGERALTGGNILAANDKLHTPLRDLLRRAKAEAK
ncbi:MAG: inositol monophosphatase [Alphaproteobacteria bacterium]|nr:inositol monophosphatase [Alphaproteobacteria bacterium]